MVKNGSACGRTSGEGDILRAIMDGTRNVHLVYLDRDFNFVRVNRAYAHTCGYRPEEMIGRNHFDLYPDWENEAIFRRVVKTGEPAEFRDKPFVFPDQPERGTTYWDWTLEPVKDVGGSVVGLVFSLVETTDRKCAEQRAEEEHGRLRAILDTLPVGVGISDRDGRVVELNGMTDEIWGGRAPKPREIDDYREYRAWRSGTREEVRPEDWATMKALKDGVTTIGEVLDIQRFDGTMGSVVHSAAPIRDAQGNMVGAVGVIQDITELRRAEEALKRSEDRMRAIAETSIIEISVSTPDGTMLFVNDAYAEAFGYSKEELIGFHTPNLYVDQKDRDVLIETLRRQGYVRDFETRVRRKDGSTFWVAASITAIDYGGQQAVLGVSINITERKKAEETLKESEAKYRGLFDILPLTATVARYILDDRGEIIDAAYEETNEAGARAVGSTPDELRGKKLSEVFGPEVVTQYLGYLNEVRRTNRPVKVEHCLEKLGRYFISIYAPVNDELWAGSSQDVTDIKRAQRQAEEEKARLQAILDTMPVGIMIADPRGKATVLNRIAQDIWRGSAPFPQGPDDDGQIVSYWQDGRRITSEDQPLMQAVVDGRAITGAVIDIRRFDGTPGTLMTSTAPIRDGDGRILGAVSALQDITEIKKLERDLQRSNEELQQFAYVASHDMQENLRMVTMYLGLLNKKFGRDIDPAAKEYMGFINSGAERMRLLINDILQYSRVDSHPSKLASVDMSAMVQAVVDDLHISIEEAKAEIVVDPLPVVLADEPQMKQLLMNLVSNAIKFRGERRPRVEVSAVTYNNEYVFSIEDNGIGIDPHHQDKLFKMFSRLHTRDEYAGSGIGLAISKKIVERHGGRIWFESEEGKGTTFFFTIPI